MSDSHSNMDDIPVEELIRITREFTRRITNQDRQRLARELRESGHQRSIQLTAPIALQQFFSGEIDLDNDLARRFVNAPLIAHMRRVPDSGDALHGQTTAILSSQDDTMIISVDAPPSGTSEVTLEFTFTLFSALALRFRLSPLVAPERRRWIDLMRRENGITFLWTRRRWEDPHLVFVVREHFARLYAFAPQGFEAAARFTPDITRGLVDWLEGLWFPGAHAEADPQTQIRSPYSFKVDHTPSHLERPRGDLVETVLPETPFPEEQWDDEPDASPTEYINDISPDDLSW